MMRIIAAVIAMLILIGLASIVAADIYYVDGYVRSNGTYVSGHYKTTPDQYKWNNLGEWR